MIIIILHFNRLERLSIQKEKINLLLIMFKMNFYLNMNNNISWILNQILNK